MKIEGIWILTFPPEDFIETHNVNLEQPSLDNLLRTTQHRIIELDTHFLLF